MSTYLRVLSVLVLLSAVIAGCVVPATPAPQAPAEATEAPAPAEEAAEVSEPEEVILTVWDTWTRDEESKVIEALDAEFEAAHPGVTVDRLVKSFDDLKATAKLAMSSPDGPDIVQINQGWPDMGAMAEAGVLANLTPYADEYGWSERISGGIAARNSFTADGKTFGEGNLYGVPPVAELVGVYYRKDIFDEVGLSVPTTFAEFEDALAKLTEAGYIPLTFGNLDGWPATQIYGEILGTMIEDRSYLDDLIYALGRGATWETPENIETANKLLEWVDNGYFTSGFGGISYGDSTALFDNGEGAMMLTGSWMSSTFAAGPNGDQIGFFLVPPAEEGGYKLSTGGTSLAYAIRADSPNVDLAAEYIDWLMSDRAAQLWVESGTVPVAPVDPGILEEGTLFADLVTAWNQMNQSDAVGHYLDWATPTFYDTLTAALQELMAKQITPEEYLQKLEADHQAFLEEKGQ